MRNLARASVIGFVTLLSAYSYEQPTGYASGLSERSASQSARVQYDISFKDRNPEIGLIGGILEFSGNGVKASQDFRAYFLNASGERIGEPVGRYVASRQSFAVPESTPVPEHGQALGVFAVEEDYQLSGLLASTDLDDYPGNLVRNLAFQDTNPESGISGVVTWKDPLQFRDFDGYKLKYGNQEQRIPKSESGVYSFMVANGQPQGVISVVPYKGDAYYYSNSQRIQSFDDVRSLNRSTITPGAPEQGSLGVAKVEDLHFKPKQLESGDMNGSFSWYDPQSSKALSYVLYLTNEQGEPLFPLVEVANDYPFDGNLYQVNLPSFRSEKDGQKADRIAIYAKRQEGNSRPETISLHGDREILFSDLDKTAGKIGGTVWVKPTFPNYGASLYFVDYWGQKMGNRLDYIQGKNRYFNIPYGTDVPEGAWKLAIYDNGGYEGSLNEKPPLLIDIADE